METSKIPTAKDFTKTASPSKFGLRQQLEDSGQLKFVHEWMNRYAAEFARLHVTAALEAAAEKAETEGQRGYERPIILNAYPLDNIK